jgi:hypothetical protein
MPSISLIVTYCLSVLSLLFISMVLSLTGKHLGIPVWVNAEKKSIPQKTKLATLQ